MDSESNSLGDKPLDENKEHLLERSWTIWIHKKGSGGDYSNALQPICSFSTVEQFWKCYHSIPAPSQVLYTSETGSKTTSEGDIEGYSIFMKDVKPEW